MSYTVHVEDIGKSKPRPHEETIAEFLADYFKSDIIFMRQLSSKTPDLYILKTNIKWELKSPTGNGKHTIQNNLRAASKQSENILLDLSRAKMSDSQSIARTKDFLKTERTKIKRLKIITKDRQVLDIKGN